jgi:hypothetical protein
MAELGPYIIGISRLEAAALPRAVEHRADALVQAALDQGYGRSTGRAEPYRDQPDGMDPRTGQPVQVNPIGALDVDIIIDEGPDAINMQADSYDTLTILGFEGREYPAAGSDRTVPAGCLGQEEAVGDVQPARSGQAAGATDQLAGEAAKVDETKSKAMLNMAKVQELGQPEAAGAGRRDPPVIKNAQAIADVNETNASATHKRAQAAHISTQAILAPHQAVHDANMDMENLKVAYKKQLSATKEPA